MVVSLNSAANAWSVLRDSPRKALAWRAVRHGEDPSVALMLRGRRGPHSLMCIDRVQARAIAQTVRGLAAERSRAPGGAPGPCELHTVDLSWGERVGLAYAVLRGEPRRSDVWTAAYLKLGNEQELVLFELAARRERRAHSRLPLTLVDAMSFADELEATAKAS